MHEFRPRGDCCIDGGASLFYFLAAAATVTAGAAAMEQGVQTEREYREKAEEEKMAATDREIARRNKVLRALASRAVGAAASGTALEGSPLALVNKDFAEYHLESLTSEAMTAGRVKSLLKAGKSARRVGTLNAVSSLFQAGSFAVQGASVPKPTAAAAQGRGSGNLGRIGNAGGAR